MRTTLSSLLLALTLVAPATLRAQANPLVGTWDLELTVGMRVSDGEPEVIRGKGRMVVAEEGDSLVATLTVTPPEGMPARPATRFTTAKVAGPRYTFLQNSEARIQGNGEEMAMRVISTWTFNVAGDALTGTVAREVVGAMMPSMPDQPVTGTRVR
jgi:hypothetical protein